MTMHTTETRTKGERVVTLPFTPNTAQDEFIHSGAPKTMFVASVAAGKTTALCMRAWMISWKYPGNKGMLARYTYDEIRDTIIPTWKKCVPKELMINPDCLDRKDLGMQTLLVHTQDPERPSEILFRNLEDPHVYESAELGWFALSQANDPKVTRRMWDTLNERLRWPVPYHFAFCNPGEAPVLMADWTVLPIRTIEEGDQVVGFDPVKRKLRIATVTAVQSRVASVSKMTLESGRTIRCTSDHRWLRAKWYKSKGQESPYAPAITSQYDRPEGIGTTHLAFVAEPSLPELTAEQKEYALWLGGLYDGEGTVGAFGRVSISQSPIRNPEVCAKIERALKALGFDYVVRQATARQNHYVIVGGRDAYRRFLLLCRPTRGAEIARKLYGHPKHSDNSHLALLHDRVLRIEPDGEERVYALTTTTGNYVVWGYASSNCEANWGGNASKGGWIWDEFVNMKQGHLVTADTLVNWDNLPEDYKARLANLPKYRQLHSVYGTASGWDPLVDIRGIPVFPEFKFGFHTPEDGSVGDVRKLFTQDRPVIRGIDVPGPGAAVWVQMDERGRLLVGHELCLDAAIGTAEFADIVQSDSAQFFPGSKYLDYVDPAAMRVEQTSGKSNANVLYEKGLRPRPAGVQIDKRLQCVKDWLTMAVRGDAGLLIDPGCHRLIGAMQGGYNYPQIGAESGRYSPVPGKSSFSHIADALQYACHGVARLQYSAQREEEPMPMPAVWLGQLRRNPRAIRREMRPEVVSTRNKRDIRVKLPRIDW